ncbi:MAG: succinate dehydrogenase, hydrophobic membrane anchor protein [Pseudomonadota bacterium]|nr:succinate dehydrogenase, hydrophobic membrane anchor protein [Pseudomonadota bacterium]
MEFRSTLRKVRGHGLSTEGGVANWWAQRMTAIALIPLTIWFVISFISLIEADYNTFIQWIKTGGNSVFLILLAIAIYHHGQLGLQVIIEDYIKNESVHFITLITVKLGSFFLAVYTIFSIARLTFGT